VSDRPTTSRLAWTEGQYSAHHGQAGGVQLFTYSWDNSKVHPGEPWVMRTALPGYGTRTWRSGSEIDLQEKAERILARWLEKVAPEPDRDAEFEAWNEREHYGHDMVDHVHFAFDAGWDARGGGKS
jgi:hypothetical protein